MDLLQASDFPRTCFFVDLIYTFDLLISLLSVHRRSNGIWTIRKSAVPSNYERLCFLASTIITQLQRVKMALRL